MLPGATPNTATTRNTVAQAQHPGHCCACAPAHLTQIEYLKDVNSRVGTVSQTLLSQNETLRAFNHSLKELLGSLLDSDAAHRTKIETLERRVLEQAEFIRELMRQLEEREMQHEVEMASGDEPPAY